MTPDIKDALTVKTQVVEFMMEYVFAGDFDNPKVTPTVEGNFSYRDRKISIECRPSHREGWFSCAVEVHVIRKSWFSKKSDLVMSTGHGFDVWTFRPGLWIDYINKLAGNARRQREAVSAASDAPSPTVEDTSFTPIDDSAIFRDD